MLGVSPGFGVQPPLLLSIKISHIIKKGASNSCFSLVSLVYGNLHSIFSSHPFWSFSWVKREANNASHHLAGWSLRNRSWGIFYCKYCPDCFVKAYKADMLGVSPGFGVQPPLLLSIKISHIIKKGASNSWFSLVGLVYGNLHLDPIFCGHTYIVCVASYSILEHALNTVS